MKKILFLLFLPSMLLALDIDYKIEYPSQQVDNGYDPIGQYAPTDWIIHMTSNCSPSQPAKGAYYNDPDYHIDMYRITASTSDLGGDGGLHTEYTFSCESSDGNYLLFEAVGTNGIQNSGYSVLSATTTPKYQVICEMPSECFDGNSEQPDFRFDQSGSYPERIYYHYNMTLRYFDVKTRVTTEVHNFLTQMPPYSDCFITMGDEGDPSENSRYWCWYVKQKSDPYQIVCMLTYDKTNDIIISSRTTNLPDNLNACYVSKSGQYVLTSNNSGTNLTSPVGGSWSWTINLVPVKCMYDYSKHNAVGYNKQGHEVVLYCGTHLAVDGTDMSTVDTYQMTRMDTGHTYPIMHQTETIYGWTNYANRGNEMPNDQWHAPGYSKRGWCFVDTYTTPCSPYYWGDNNIWALELDETKSSTNTVVSQRPRIWRFPFPQHLTPAEYYYYQPNVSINSAGTRVYFGSSWKDGTLPSRNEAYMYNLPANWYTDLGGEAPSNPTIFMNKKIHGRVSTFGKVR